MGLLADALLDSDDEGLRKLLPLRPPLAATADSFDEDVPFPLSPFRSMGAASSSAMATIDTAAYEVVTAVSSTATARERESHRPTGRLAFGLAQRAGNRGGGKACGPMGFLAERLPDRVGAGQGKGKGRGPTGFPAERLPATVGAGPSSMAEPVWASGELLVCPESHGSVRDIARSRLLSAVLHGVHQDPGMVWHFPVGKPSGVESEWKALCESAETTVRRLTQGRPTCFKIGLTRDPMHRWWNGTYGYRREGFTRMTVLCATVPAWAAALETHLIATFKSYQGCWNMASGGESTPSDPPVFVYVVSVLSHDHVAWTLTRVRAQVQD